MSERSALRILLMPKEKITYTLPVDKRDKVLIISPHPDDETLGCGGAIIKMLSSSIDVAVLMLTDGNGGGRQKDISRIRKEEFMRAKSALGYTSSLVLNYPDGQLVSYQEELVNRIREILFEQAPKLIFIPYLLDYPIDHRTANIALAQALNTAPTLNTVIGMYEIWTPMANPNCYLNITDEYSCKKTVMACYQSQENYLRIVDKADALSTFRAKLSMRKRVEHMECFMLLETKEYVSMVESWKAIQSCEEESKIEYAVY
ncbi:MAG: PIG-L family deacetylase [Clostridiales bacterium]|jgi:LmbE family N-acetylglucosaminyl deacetylase|nr:PIG-L family deacetylase [Clostridiales bacterium]